MFVYINSIYITYMEDQSLNTEIIQNYQHAFSENNKTILFALLLHLFGHPL